MHAAKPLCVVAIGAALAACSSAESGGPAWLAAEAEPVKLTIELESDNSASRTISEAGGTISATAEDGTRFRLRIPEGALLSSTVITMTPVASVKGLPLKGEGGYATVQLEPEGLQLLKPAVLSIRSKREIPASEQVAFAYHNLGDDAHLYPLGADTSKVELSLLHFSGYGWGAAPRNDPGRLALQLAADREARLAARIAEAINRERQRTEEGASEEFQGELLNIQVAYYDEVLRDLLRQAETNDRMAVCAIQRYLGWMRQAMLLAIVDSETGESADPELNRRLIEAEKSSSIVHRNFYEKRRERAMRKCRQHDFSFVSDLISLERQRQLLGVSETEGDGLDDARDLMRDCMQFEVDFESTFDYRFGSTAAILYRVNARVPFELPLSHSMGTPLGSGALRYGEHNVRGNAMEWLLGSRLGSLGATASPAGTTPGVFKVLGLDWDMNPTTRPGVSCDGADAKFETDSITNVSIVFAPGIPREKVRYRAVNPFPGQPASWTDEEAGWADDWGKWHRDEFVAVRGLELQDGENAVLGGAYRIKLEPSGAGQWRAEVIRAGDPGQPPIEISNIVVRHRPR